MHRTREDPHWRLWEEKKTREKEEGQKIWENFWKEMQRGRENYDVEGVWKRGGGSLELLEVMDFGMQKTKRKRLSSRRKDRGRKEEISGSETLTRRYCTDDRNSRSLQILYRG